MEQIIEIGRKELDAGNRSYLDVKLEMNKIREQSHELDNNLRDIRTQKHELDTELEKLQKDY